MENHVLAKVNGIEITDAILDSTIASLPPERRSYFDSEYGRNQLLEQLVSVELINAFGTELGLDTDPHYQAQVEQALKDIKYSFTMNKVFGAITIEEEEAKTVFDENPDLYQGEASIRASHILVDNEDLAKELIGKLNGGELSFEEAAMAHSSCPSKEQGGDLGEFGRGMMVKEFEDAAFALEEGEMTAEPVATQFGYHIIRTTEKKGTAPVEFEAVKSQVMNRMLQEKQMEYYTKLLIELKEKFPVEYK